VTDGGGVPTAFVDRFVLDRLPPRTLWPHLAWSGADAPVYPDRLNAAAALLDDWVATGHGGRTVFHHADGAWTYQRLHDTANRIAQVLVDDFQVVPGGRVMLRGANHPWLVACWFAVLKAGAVAVTTMPLLRRRELAEIVERARVGLALTDADVAADLDQVGGDHPGLSIVRYNTAAPDGLDARLAGRPPVFAAVATAAADPAIIAFTSGTTGRGKATVHLHRDLLAVADSYSRHVVRPTAADVFIGSPPLAFTYGLGGLVLFPLRAGASTALLGQASPPQLLEGIQRFRATITVTSPTGYRAMLADAHGYDLGSLRGGLSAGEMLPAAVFEAWHAATGVRLMDGIGSTEMLHVFIGSRPDQARPGSTGRVVPGYEARVIDDAGQEVPRGTVGRLAVRGPTGCRYLDDLEQQQRYVQHGWNVTGDAYLQDADGYFWYQCRTDDMIVSSGYNIAGAEVENALLTAPGVAECAVVGVADDARGQIVKAFVVPAPGVEPSAALVRALQDHVKAQIAPYKYPRAVEFVTALPRTLTGKVQRFRLRRGTGQSEPLAAAGGVMLHEPAGWPRPSGYANAVSAAGRLVFVSGQIGWDPVTGTFPSTAFPDQVHQALANVVAALAAAGASPAEIVRLTWYVTDRELYRQHRREVGASYRALIGRHFPAMSVVVVAGLVEPAALVEIEATAVVASDPPPRPQ
jgi:2-aminobenzoate-CoA ligase